MSLGVRTSEHTSLKKKIMGVLAKMDNCPKLNFIHSGKFGEKPVIFIEVKNASWESFNTLASILRESNLFDITVDSAIDTIAVELKYTEALPTTYAETANMFMEAYNQYCFGKHEFFSKLKALLHHYCHLRGITQVKRHSMYGTYIHEINGSWGECGVKNWVNLIRDTKDLVSVESTYIEW